MNQKKEILFNGLTEYWQTVVDDLVQSLRDVDRYVSGNTAQAIGETPKGEPKIVHITTQGFNVKLWMTDYYEFIDEGVSGAKYNKGISRFKYTDKMPPISAIRKFMAKREINPVKRSNTKSGKRRDAEAIRDGVAFAIARKIYENGLKPTNFYSNVMNDEKILDMERMLMDKFGVYVLSIVEIK